MESRGTKGGKGFNRTFMELKRRFVSANQNAILRFNRTFMELKLRCISSFSYFFVSFNRTFMELKRAEQV